MLTEGKPSKGKDKSIVDCVDYNLNSCVGVGNDLFAVMKIVGKLLPLVSDDHTFQSREVVAFRVKNHPPLKSVQNI